MARPILIGCECSGRTREAMRALGYEAWSCDLKPAEDGSPFHIQGDVMDALSARPWGLAILHPVCTFLANSGAKHLYRGMNKKNGRCPERWAKMEDGARFYKDLRDKAVRLIPRVAVENPVMHRHAIERTGRGRTIFVHPYYFGDPFFKLTGLELINLPDLVATDRLDPPAAGTEEHKRWSAVHRARPGPDRARIRSVTYPKLAEAFAAQWGHLA